MDGYVTIGTKLETKSFDSQIAYIEQQLQEIEFKLKQADMGFDVGDTMKLEQQYEKLSNQLTGLKTKQLELNKADFGNVSKSVDKVGDSVGKVIKKVGRWVLAVFAIESAYGMVRRGMSLLSQYNDRIKDDVNYITYAMATALQPIIEGLISLAYKLLGYISYIAKAWFGVNIFANASAKSMKTASQSAKELKKSLAGFDEMNVLTGTSSSANTVTPSVDLSTWQGEVPSWIKWIADNKDIVIAGLAGIAGGLTAVGLGFNFVKGLGIGLILAGLILLIQGIVDFLKDPSWNNFLTILQGISLVVAGIALLFGGWIVALIALGAAIIATVIKNWDKVMEILGAVAGWVFNNIYKPIADFFVGLWNGIKDGASKAWDGIKSVFSTVGSFFSGIFDKIKSIFKNIGQTIGDVVGSAFKTAINAVLSLADNIINAPIKAINKLIGVINAVPGINLGKLSEIKIPRLASGAIVNYPNKGVYSNGTIRGEAGAEGVIPLTDSQAMEQLGSAIGRYITVNNTVNTVLNGKVINRELHKVDANTRFATNG